PAMVLTILALVIGYLTLSMSVALLYATWFSSAGHEVTSQFLAFASICSLGFATLSGWLTALVAQRAPIAHAGGLAALLTLVWGISTFAVETSEPLSIALLNLAVGITGVMTGGWWRFRQMKARDQAQSKA
ncbi:MAG: hypothetical protein AAFP03_12885, partial [Cyanobacteria bacterium J06598_3]